jgi:hypothetical protein
VLWQAGVVGDLTLARGATGADCRRLLVDVLARDYPLDHRVIVYRAATLPIERPRMTRVRLRDLPGAAIEAADTLVIAPAKPLRANAAMGAKVAALQRSRARA